MDTRKLGKTGMEVAPLAFGANVFGWTVDEARAFKLLDAFASSGFNLIDTADIYSHWAPGNKGGESETIIGKWLKLDNNRERVLIATKVGGEMGPGEKGLSKAYIMRAAEDSLKRLRTDYIDLYQSHFEDPSTPQEETLEAFAQLVKDGKVRAIGVSNHNPDKIAEALKISEDNGWPRYEVVQTLYNMYDRAEYETKYEALCRDNNLGVLTYFSLAKGFLSGKYKSESDLKQSPRGSGVKSYLNPRGTRILNALDQVSRRLNATPVRIALAWLMTRPTVTAPIASATSLEQLDELIKGTQLELDEVSLEMLEEASTPAVAA